MRGAARAGDRGKGRARKGCADGRRSDARRHCTINGTEARTLEAIEEYRAGQSREYLEHVRGLVAKKAAWESIMEQDAALLEQLRAIDYRRERVDGTPTPPDIADLLDRLDANRARHAALMAELVEAVDGAQRTIMKLDAPFCELLLLRYVSAWQWDDVAARLNYSTDYCRKELHDVALILLYWELPPMWRDPRPPATDATPPTIPAANHV